MKDPRWYIIRPTIRGDFLASKELDAQKIDVFLPTFKIFSLIKHTKGQRRSRTRLLMPTYLFARLSGDQFRHVLGKRDERRSPCLHVHSIYRPQNSTKPMWVSDKALEQLRQLCTDGFFDQGKRNGDGFERGDRVWITDGPLAGTVMRFKDGKAKAGYVRLMVDKLLGKEVVVSVPEESVRAA